MFFHRFRRRILNKRSPRLLIVNNIPAFYRTRPFNSLVRHWADKTSGSSLVVYQARRDPHRRGEWFFTPDDEFPYAYKFLAQRTIKVWGVVNYPPKFGVFTLMCFRPTHLLVAGWDSPISLACAAYAGITRSRTAFWVESNETTSRRSGLLARCYRRALLRSADLAVVPTQASADHVNKIAGRKVDSVLLPNPVSLQRLPLSTSNSRRFIYLGDFSERKGFDIFLRACALGAATQWTGVAWGADVEGLSYSRPPNCELRPAAPLHEILPSLSSNDVWLIPSRRDPAPLTYSEALALGLRVVVSDAIAYAEHAGRTNGAGVARVDDPSSFLLVAESLREAAGPGRSASAEVTCDNWASTLASALVADESNPPTSQ